MHDIEALRRMSKKDRGCNPDHKGFMLNAKGVPLLCMWEDCTIPGRNEHHLDILDREGIHHFIFCGQFHRSLFVWSHKNLGHVAPGDEKRGNFR
jgi:hypothetical protein